MVTGRLYPPAIHYTVTYSRPPDFDHVSLEVLEVIMTGTDQPQVTFPLPVYNTNGECMCFISQVCGEALPSPVALLHYSFVKYNVVEVYTMIPFCLHDCDFLITLMGHHVHPFRLWGILSAQQNRLGYGSSVSSGVCTLPA